MNDAINETKDAAVSNNPPKALFAVLALAAVLLSSLCLKMAHDNKSQLLEMEVSLREERALVRQMARDYEEVSDMRRELEELKNTPPESVPVICPVVTEVPVYIDKEVMVPRDFRVFDSAEELNEWLEAECLPVTLIAGSTGRISLSSPRTTAEYDCDDYAEELQKKALAQGYLMSQQLVYNGRLFGVKVSEYTGPHMGNLTMVGGDIYYVESIPPHKAVKVVSRD
jgi:hypothetical protein